MLTEAVLITVGDFTDLWGELRSFDKDGLLDLFINSSCWLNSGGSVPVYDSAKQGTKDELAGAVAGFSFSLSGQAIVAELLLYQEPIWGSSPGSSLKLDKDNRMFRIERVSLLKKRSLIPSARYLDFVTDSIPTTESFKGP